MRHLVLKNWERFQHYKDRDPPWVKFYRDILTTESWVLGTDSSRLLQVASILLAARYTNKIPLNYPLLRKVASLDLSEKEFTKAVQHLEATNFLEIQACPEETKLVAQSASGALATCTTETEQRRADKRQSREDISVPQERDDVPRGTAEQVWREMDPERAKASDDIAFVFDHWRREHDHPKAQLDKKRRALITAALKSYAVGDLCESISGYKNSPHHMGQNDRNTAYTEIELLLRDAKRIDAGLKFARGPPLAETDTTAHNKRALEQWVNDGQGAIRDGDGQIGGGVQSKNLPAPSGPVLGLLVPQGNRRN